ncbi:MAG: hypothetical protein LVQ63_05405 [Thermoplasmatales archaeon]|nr:hypothetical protein [Thermoplasmatales archaeon]
MSCELKLQLVEEMFNGAFAFMYLKYSEEFLEIIFRIEPLTTKNELHG